MKALLALAFSAIALPASAQSLLDGKFACIAQRASACDPQGCRTLEPGQAVSITIDLRGKTYRRCGDGSCDQYDAVVSEAGATAIAELPGRGAFAKLVYAGPTPGGVWMVDYSEVVSLGTTVLVTTGYCLGIE